tara:strand:+ start:61 stop:591 length:531 start_codon:yes stop_codon:yes gene_type:complete
LTPFFTLIHPHYIPDFGPGLVSGAINRFKEIEKEKSDNPADPAWPTYKGGELGSFRKGLQTLPTAVEKHLGADRVKLDHELVGIEKGEDGIFKATFKTGGTTTTYHSKSIVLTSPPIPTSKIVPKSLIPSASLLENVYSPPVASVTLAMKKEYFKEVSSAVASAWRGVAWHNNKQP